LILGSFANVCIYRLPLNKQIVTGRSFCPKCKKKINWYDNIPLISFILLEGKCRKCKKEISIKYLLVELISGISFVFIFLNYNNYLEIAFLQVLVIIFLIIFFIDLKHFIIPDSLNFSLIILAISKNFIPNFESNFTYDLNQSIVGGILGYFVIWIIIFLYKKIKNLDAMGLGDAKLMAGIGLLFGWKSIPFVLFVSAIIGLISVIPSLINKTKNLRTEIPFGPYIIVSTIIYYFCGNLIL
jgi:leader peptidase (prepilin peptidase)/N-methyltransferase|tara:strand:+ start:632 stop:1354 length:723 start_codon:yes stop_codon:yes gene_type:complete